jgi:hypothetical protein
MLRQLNIFDAGQIDKAGDKTTTIFRGVDQIVVFILALNIAPKIDGPEVSGFFLKPQL